ncbi:MAG: germination protein YpeB [Oscillospiraceae bacterium]|nr:germination protein YpeB [Oscillospiraceae bacterium]
MENKKEKKRTRRGKIRVFSFLGAVIIALGAFGVSESAKRKSYERLISISQQRALSELGTYLDNIELSLKKGKYAASAPMISNLASTLWRDSTGAKTSLSQLGAGETPLANTYKFLSQVGEFTMALNRKVADGGRITEEEKKQLESFQNYAQGLCEQLHYMELMVENGNLDFERIESTLSQTADKEDAPANFIDTMNNAEQALTDYPTLLYDGPFADNLDQKESCLLKEHAEISKDEAKAKAAGFADVDINTLAEVDDEEGKMPCYIFGGKDFTISVTKNGGLLNYMLGNAYAGEAKMDEKEAAAKAKEYLKKHGFENMKESYYSTADGICTINFAYTENEIIYYPDLIKVSVALDTGRVVSVDARGYIMNHHKRSIDQAPLSINDCAAKLATGLQILKTSQAVIPKDNGDERFTYEFHCKDAAGQEVLIYIDPKNGDEAEILLLMYADGGILTK